jgi:hypothetical protein
MIPTAFDASPSKLIASPLTSEGNALRLPWIDRGFPSSYWVYHFEQSGSVASRMEVLSFLNALAA